MAGDGAHWAAVVPAAGLGLRMKGEQPKQFLTIGRRPILVHTLATLAACPDLETLMVVVPNQAREETIKMIQSFGVGKVAGVVAGGDTRQQSVINGVEALSPKYDYVLIHDGVRPLVDLPTVERVMAATRDFGAATVGIPAQDTLARVDKHNQVKEILPRNRVWQIQTPQAFWRPMLAEAQLKAKAEGHMGTDEAGLVLRMDKPVRMVEGSPLNIKLTTPSDMKAARALMGWREDNS